MTSIITKDNYTSFFSFSAKRFETLCTYYPVLESEFKKYLMYVYQTYNAYPYSSNDLTAFLEKKFVLKQLPDDDNANRQVIYSLADIYFISCIWYNMFKLATGFEDSNFTKIGKSNQKLAKYIKNLIIRYNFGSDMLKQDNRDVGKGISMSWVTYEDMVYDSLKYTDNFDKGKYHKLVNLALVDKLGLEEIYRK